ncbi:LptF/LptG family permease [uncultured Brachyspira sp.]|uniref:LptF/LptG family permease n=1 Tax=uncultured Brachyspira sp. TaxID=221953 RepID=UPI002636E5B9|nr:LptF/LptG family permease [uncultured Brachyspira sp.]
MNKITKYIIAETIGPFLAGILFFTFVFVIQLLPELIRLIMNNGAPLWMSLETFVYMLPFNIGITIPMSILMASIIGYGRLSSDNEIIVMRALGFPHMRIYMPIIILGVITFIFSLFFNNIIMSESNYRYRALISYMVNIRPSIAVGKLEFANIEDMGLSIGAKYADDKSISNVVIYDGSKTKRVITAKYGLWKNNEANSQVVTLTLYDGVVQEMPNYGFVSNDYTVFDSMDINIVRDVSTLTSHERGLREMPSWEIRKKINIAKSNANKSVDEQITGMINNSYKGLKKKPDLTAFSNEYITTNAAELTAIREKAIDEAVPYFYYIEFHKFISIPAACLFMVLIGAPLGIVGKRSGKGFGFGISVIVVVIYYLLITAAELMAGGKKVPPMLAMWFPNIVLALMGSFFMIRSFFSRGK